MIRRRFKVANVIPTDRTANVREKPIVQLVCSEDMATEADGCDQLVGRKAL